MMDFNNKGRFNADIIFSQGDGYRGIFSFEFWPDIDISWCKTWREFASEVDRRAAIVIPARKHFQFSRLSDFEKIAGIDATHTRESCIVTAADRRAGWRRWNFD